MYGSWFDTRIVVTSNKLYILIKDIDNDKVNKYNKII